jgi:hypothetical protein
MSDIETYGGECPHCAKPLLMWKYPGSFSIDACIHCGFIHGFFEGENVTVIEGNKAQDVFFNIIDHHACSTIEELRSAYSDRKTGKDTDELFPSVFNYEADTLREIKSRVVDLTSIPEVIATKHRL